MAGQWWMTQTAVGNENGGGLQTASVDDIRRWRMMMMAEADDGDDGLRMTKRTAAADDMKYPLSHIYKFHVI